MAVAAGSDFTATLVDPGGLISGVGARVEVPVTRAVASYWRAATLAGDVWTVTLGAPASAGDYNLVWRTDDAEPPEFEAFVPLLVVGAGAAMLVEGDFPTVDVDQVKPTVEDVARLERNRTIQAGGVDVGTFNDQTTPTDAEVDELIDEATDLVLVQLPSEFDPEYYGQVRRAIAIQAAILVEASFYPEQGNDQAVQRRTNLLATLIASLQARITVDYNQRYADETASGALLA